MESTTETHNQSIYRVVDSCLNEDVYKNTLTQRAERTLRKRGQEDCESQRIKILPLKLCHLGISETIPVKSHQLPYQSMLKAVLLLIEKFIAF